MNNIANKIKEKISAVITKVKSFFSKIKNSLRDLTEKIKYNLKKKSNKDIESNKYRNDIEDSQTEQSNTHSFEPIQDVRIHKIIPETNNEPDNSSLNSEQEVMQNDKEKNIITERIQRIEIKEETGETKYITEQGNVYNVDISEILYEKKSVYKDFKISEKCRELTGSFFKGKKLERLLNPLVVYGLKNNEDLDKYINCVCNEESLFFDLQHDTKNSKLGFFNKMRMRKIAEFEKVLGADVLSDMTFFEKIKIDIKDALDTDKRREIKEEKMIFKQFEKVKKMFYKGTYKRKDYSELERILTTCSDWYLKNARFNEADKCISLLKELLKEQRKKYYIPRYNEEYNKGNQEYALESILQEESIKRYNFKKLKIKREFLVGNREIAEELYRKMLQELHIYLTEEEFAESMKNNALLNGTYCKLTVKKQINSDGTYTVKQLYRNIQIIGNERVLEELKNLRNTKNLSADSSANKEISYAKTNSGIAKEETDQTNVEKSEIASINQDDRDKIVKLIIKSNKLTADAKYKKGAIIVLMQNIITYLQDNNDEEVEKRLKKEIDVFTSLVHAPYVVGSNIAIWNYFSKIYKDGVESSDSERVIIEKDEKKWAYYLYIANRYACQLRSKTIPSYWSITQEELQSITDEYNANKTIVCDLYLQYVREKNQNENESGINSLISEARFFEELSQLTIAEYNSDYLNLSIAYEKALRINNSRNNGVLQEIINELQEKINQSSEVEDKAIDLLSEIHDKKQASEFETKNRENSESYTYVCSDIHSEYSVYRAIVDQLKEKDKLYILGDVIDRGEDGIKILQDIMERHEKGQVEFFVGNHEYMMIQSLFLNNQVQRENWEKNNDGLRTEKAYYALPIEQQEKIKQFLMNALVYKKIQVNEEDIYLVHAKAVNDSNQSQETVLDMINSGREQELYDAVWVRSGERKSGNSGEIWQETDIAQKGIFTIIGHTPTFKNSCDGIMFDNNGILYIDCGASYGEREALIRLEDGKVIYIDTKSEREKSNSKERE